jgi:hypothetical protein
MKIAPQVYEHVFFKLVIPGNKPGKGVGFQFYPLCPL